MIKNSLKFKKLKKPKYLMLPMLLQEGGQGHCHLINPSQHMETAPVLVATVPTIGRSHRHRHFEPSHFHPGEEKFLPTYSF